MQLLQSQAKCIHYMKLQSTLLKMLMISAQSPGMDAEWEERGLNLLFLGTEANRSELIQEVTGPKFLCPSVYLVSTC